MAILSAGERVGLHHPEKGVIYKVLVDRVDCDLVLGTYARTPGFEGFRSLFEEFDECVSRQAFTALDAIDDEISKLGLFVLNAEKQPVVVHDIQLFVEGSCSFRLADRTKPWTIPKP